MEKIKINLKEIELQTFQFGDMSISLKPYLQMLDKVRISMEYLSTLFNGEDSDISSRYLIAEYALILQVVDLLSNIDVTDLDVDLFIYCGLWDEIKKKVVNYESFRYDLNRLILFYQNDLNNEISIGSVVEKLGNKFLESIKEFSSADIQELKEASETFVGALSKLNETVPGITEGKATRRAKVKKSE